MDCIGFECSVTGYAANLFLKVAFFRDSNRILCKCSYDLFAIQIISLKDVETVILFLRKTEVSDVSVVI